MSFLLTFKKKTIGFYDDEKKCKSKYVPPNIVLGCQDPAKIPKRACTAIEDGDGFLAHCIFVFEIRKVGTAASFFPKTGLHNIVDMPRE